MTQANADCMRCSQPVASELIQCPYCEFELGSGEAPEAWIGEIIDNKYEVEEILGVGGMGMVFKARRQMIGDQVALKILFPRFMKNELQQRLFRSEALATAALNDPHVITIFDTEVDETYGVAYMAMELLEGFTFKEYMISEAPMAPEKLYPIITQVCDGLSAAHLAGIIHRDLKPDNLFLSRTAKGDFHVKVLDFGIATVMGQYHADESNKLLGTLRYMAPEQCRGEDVSAPTDLYALGVIMYESLTRQRATGKSIDSVLYDKIRQVNDHLPAEKTVPKDLENLVMKLLAKQAEQRPQTANELKDNILSLADPLRVPAPKQVQTQPILRAPYLQEQPPINSPDEWEQREMTPILISESKKDLSISIIWYVIPAFLFIVLIYFVTKIF